ncbi:malate synthase [Paenibacillus sp. FA6]|uniref:malate synthase n=1 Tax=Paenibacillus sp. FA6 TaxID=3413029 RepID=UPI003F6600D4
MNLLNEEITHKVFGIGSIVDQNESVITIDFNDHIKKFVYPDAFEKFIKLNDRNTSKSLQKIIANEEIKKEALERKVEEVKALQALEQQRREKLKNLKIHESSQIVLSLDEEEQQKVFTDWRASTGKVQNGKNKGQPNRVARLLPNSACLLTARESNQPETERRILGLYMVNETFFSDLSHDEMVPAHMEFRIKLTDQEAANMLFWNYYVNKNFPQRLTWNSGKYRYFDNIWTAQILKDIIALRTDEEEIEEAKNFLEYFCHINLLDMDNIPKAQGALNQ